MRKLVRDRIPEIVAAKGLKQRVGTLTDDEYRPALIDKLLEEVEEFRSAPDGERLAEAADIYEVLLALLDLDGYGPEDLARAAESKRLERGGFACRWWWEAAE